MQKSIIPNVVKDKTKTFYFPWTFVNYLNLCFIIYKLPYRFKIPSAPELISAQRDKKGN